MAREATAEKLHQTGAGVTASVPRPVAVHGDVPPPQAQWTPIGNGRIAVMVLLGAETMLFTGLIGAYVVLRDSSPMWPPPGMPHLPLAVTWANTAVLVLSCVTMQRANAAVRAGNPARLERFLTLTALLGIMFIAVQGSEWIQLVLHGMTVAGGVYGASFFALIGLHGLHVLGAVLWLLWVLARARGDRFSAANAVTVDMVGIYWYYVGGLWLILFPLVYLL